MNKTCTKCHETKPLDEFSKDNRNKKNGKQSQCKECNEVYREEHKEENKKYQKKWYERIGRERQGKISMHENKLCAAYLGVVIAERLCRHLFKNVEVMPYGNTGYDIVCKKGKKIDVKSSCTRYNYGKYPSWAFDINYNTIPDFFILVAFDNITDLNPIHLWMIPAHILSKQTKTQVSPSTIHKWDKYKKDIKDAQLCCAELKESNHELQR